MRYHAILNILYSSSVSIWKWWDILINYKLHVFLFFVNNIITSHPAHLLSYPSLHVLVWEHFLWVAYSRAGEKDLQKWSCPGKMDKNFRSGKCQITLHYQIFSQENSQKMEFPPVLQYQIHDCIYGRMGVCEMYI